MSSVYFDPAVGGDGSTVTDDSNATTGLANGGHWTRLVPMLSQTLAVASWVKDTALIVLGYKNDASNSASLANTRANAAYDSQTAAADSATDAANQVVLATAERQLAADWAAKPSGTVDGTNKSAKLYALDAAGYAASLNMPLITGVADANKVVIVNTAGNAYTLKKPVDLADFLFASQF